MSVLIKGMDMPKDRPIVISIFPNGRVDTMEVKYFDSVLSAVEVPTQHGDLIDRDVLRRKYQKMATDAYTVNIKAKMETVINACIDQLEYAETVIESEE